MATEIWSDLHDTFVTDSQGNIKKAINIEAVKVSIKNILGTYKGERIMFPEFGSNLGDMLFEPMNASLLNRISTDIKDNINIWDDRVIVTNVGIQFDPDNSFIDITVTFNVKGYTENFTTNTIITP